ncbi:hypothetical protein E8F11_24925 [Pseudomonas sp. BN417]|nr:hypothetical protein [Pseudomonas sp. BN417]
MPSSLSCFSLGDVAFAATTSKLDKDLQGDKESYTASHRDMACRLVGVSGEGQSPALRTFSLSYREAKSFEAMPL